ncbi:MAG: hypothetical protein NTV40_00820, partial [Solirubrobacterales bacterium]|nr:hypothetical protein [Solirubrobacterales bacterium]
EAAGAAIAIAIDDRTKTERNIDTPLAVLPKIRRDVREIITSEAGLCVISRFRPLFAYSEVKEEALQTLTHEDGSLMEADEASSDSERLQANESNLRELRRSA